MKKILLFAALLPAYLFAGEWVITKNEPDELLGATEAYTSYIYQDGDNAFGFRSDMPDHITLFGEHVFAAQQANGYVGQTVKIGLYDADGKLVQSMDMFLLVKDGYTTLGTNQNKYVPNPYGQTKNARKIISHLRAGGAVRFVAKTRSHGNFDLRVEPLPAE